MNIIRKWRIRRLQRKLARLEGEWQVIAQIVKDNKGSYLPMAFADRAQQTAGAIAEVRMHLEQLK